MYYFLNPESAQRDRQDAFARAMEARRREAYNSYDEDEDDEEECDCGCGCGFNDCDDCDDCDLFCG